MKISADIYWNAYSGASGAKIADVKLPNFGGHAMYTKSEPTMSEKEYENAIVKLAREQEQRGVFQELTVEFANLQKDYVQVASPDRKGIITAGLEAIGGDSNMVFPKKGEEPPNLIKMMLGEEKGTLQVKADRINGKITYAEFRDANGEDVADYSRGKWCAIVTEAEIERHQSFSGIYNKAWKSAHNSRLNGVSGAATAPPSENVLDISV